MGKTLVRVLKPFGQFGKGTETEIDESRLEFLLSRKLVKEISERTPEPEPEPETNNELEDLKEALFDIEEGVNGIGDQLSIPRNETEKLIDYINRIGEELAKDPDAKEGEATDAGKASAEDISPFDTYLRERFNGPVVDRAIEKFPTAEALRDADIKDLMALEFIGEASGNKLKLAAAEFLGG